MVGYPYGLNKILMALNNYCFVFIANSTILQTLLTGFFQMIHGLYDYHSVDLLHPYCKNASK